MSIAILIIVILAIGFAALMFSNFGSNVKTKTDQQLYNRFNRYLKHQKLYGLGSDGWMKAREELKRMGDEFVRRGYDLDKLMIEETNAKWEERPMDFSRCLLRKKL